MLLKYNYDNLNAIIDMFKDNKIATFEMRKNFDGYFIMEYTITGHYTTKEQDRIHSVLRNALPERMHAIEILNAFQEAVCSNAEVSMYMSFDAFNYRKCRLTYSSTGFNIPQGRQDNVSRLYNCMCQMDHIITEMGIAGILVDGIYVKNTKGRKYVPATLSHVNNAIRNAVSRK